MPGRFSRRKNSSRRWRTANEARRRLASRIRRRNRERQAGGVNAPPSCLASPSDRDIAAIRCRSIRRDDSNPGLCIESRKRLRLAWPSMRRAAWTTSRLRVATGPMRFRLLLLAVSVVLGSGCATIEGYGVREHERILAAAGFRSHPADTPELQQELPSLPPHRLVSRTKDGNIVYMYADPDNCQCVYIGGGKEYSEYERLRVERPFAPRLGGSSPSGGAVGGAP